MVEGISESALLALAKEAALLGGREIMDVYQNDFDVVHKEDNSPLTIADQRANRVIEEHLKTTEIPILSEEGIHLDYDTRKKWEYLWIVDPLDGTKEFIKRNGEFTVNIALVKNGLPILGVIYVPVKNWMYFGNSKGSFKQINNEVIKLPFSVAHRPYTAVGSRSHPSKETADFCDQLKKEKGEVNVVSMGSSLKICLVAEGTADVYPRFAPTMEWDTAAGHAILSGAGGYVIKIEDKEPLRYGKPGYKNPFFVAASKHVILK